MKVPKDADEGRALPEVALEALPLAISRLRAEMKAAAAKLDFERAAELRDRVKALEQMQLDIG